jgi:hypothetical protein
MFIVQKKMYTYSEDFFMTTFFTLKPHGVSTTVLVAGGEVTPADGSVPTSWRSGSGGEAGGLQMDNVSVQ